MGNYSLSRKWFSRTQSTPIRCGSRLVSGVDFVMTNPFHFDLFIFIKQMGIQNTVRIIFKQSICFDSIEKKKKKRNNKTQKKGEILSCDNISFLCLRGIDLQQRHLQLFTCSTLFKNCLWEQETFAELTCEILSFFSCNNYSIFMHPRKDEVGGRMLWTTSALLLFRSLLVSDQFYVLHNPGNYRSRSQGDKITINDAAHKFEVLMGEEAEGLWKCLHNQRKYLSPFALGCTKAPPEWALHSLWNTRWMRVKTSPTGMVLRRCSSNFMVQFHLGQLNQAGKFYSSLGGWGHILATWHILLLWWYFRNSFLGEKPRRMSYLSEWKSICYIWFLFSSLVCFSPSIPPQIIKVSVLHRRARDLIIFSLKLFKEETLQSFKYKLCRVLSWVGHILFSACMGILRGVRLKSVRYFRFTLALKI